MTTYQLFPLAPKTISVLSCSVCNLQVVIQTRINVNGVTGTQAVCENCGTTEIVSDDGTKDIQTKGNPLNTVGTTAATPQGV